MSAMKRLAPLSVIGLVMLVACGSSASSAEMPGGRVRRLQPGDSLPNLTRVAGYAGTLPGADRATIETWLTLHPDGSYRIRERNLRRATAPIVTVGRWSVSRDSVPQVALLAGDSVTHRFAMRGALTLAALNADGSAIDTEDNVELVRVSMPAELGATVHMRGEFKNFADAATLNSCNGGVMFPVTGEGGFVALQGAHREQHLGTGAAILIDAVGRLEMKPGAEDSTTVETFVVESYTVVERKERCNATAVHALIAIGDWQLGALDGVKLPELARTQQPTLRFVLSEPLMFGNGGCNRFTGRPVLRGLRLVPGAVASTKMFCGDEGVMPREQAYNAALSGGGYFRLDGAELVLSRAGTEVARFWRR
jgi:heat shock protein HslJ/uncharacterized lipoprotein NlpE involved in copper resistance